MPPLYTRSCVISWEANLQAPTRVAYVEDIHCFWGLHSLESCRAYSFFGRIVISARILEISLKWKLQWKLPWGPMLAIISWKQLFEVGGFPATTDWVTKSRARTKAWFESTSLKHTDWQSSNNPCHWWVMPIVINLNSALWRRKRI